LTVIVVAGVGAVLADEARARLTAYAQRRTGEAAAVIPVPPPET
jgi:hypothetical protein